MTIFVDADACPVKEIIVNEAKKRQIPVTMLIDTSHVLNDGYSTVVQVDKGRDAADFKLIALCKKGDVVVTQDYGVAAMALGKGAKALNQNGLIYTNSNIDELLYRRYENAKDRKKGKYTSTPKRTKQDDESFQKALCAVLEEI